MIKSGREKFSLIIVVLLIVSTTVSRTNLVSDTTEWIIGLGEETEILDIAK
ncbi:MAG: hypothetical protein ACTSO3_14345 [Candidatus Heimdallarchaeaceae archaeon]